MNRPLFTTLLATLAATLLMLGNFAHTATNTRGSAQARLSNGEILEVNAFIDPADQIVARQNVKLTIETATSGWFTGGTRITIPEVPGLLILQNEKFASNASERRNGDTWVIQRWTMDVYALQAGDYLVPPLEMAVQLKTSEGTDISGLVTTAPISISAILPAALRGLNEWVAAPDFFVRQTFDRPLDSLAVGDAFEQTIEFGASDVMAMMLPLYKPQSLAGIAAYPLPPVVENKINRGQNIATRSRRISYIIEKPGKFTLPAQDYFWWNTRSHQLELVTLGAVTLDAGGSPVNAGATPVSRATTVRAAQVAAAVLLIGLLGLALVCLRQKAFIGKPIKYWVIKTGNRVRQLSSNALPDELNP